MKKTIIILTAALSMFLATRVDGQFCMSSKDCGYGEVCVLDGAGATGKCRRGN